ncbi:hypothetical protein CUN85_12900 [Methanolobus halotolerans]|uniref:Uncharacterized protein n=2 Tax=Methanolobus halotolerans TaxID=2052935 RepID=A0A4E0PSK5_9EURY|nr:hypothetical protein CUN85_12900 [Methanolobus halotolerans]
MTVLDAGEQTLIPHINKLQDYYLVTCQSGAYELTSMGKMILDKITHLLTLLEEVERTLKCK